MINRYLPVLLSTLLFTGCGSEKETDKGEPDLRPVKTFTVGANNGGLSREFPGVVDALNKADLAFRVTGKLQSMLVNEGDEVKLGQVIAKLDDTDYKIQLDSYQASYDQAEADFSRASELIKKGYLSSSDYDALKTKQSTAKANLDAAKQSLLYTTLYAPFSGYIAKRHVENFEEVTSGQPIFTLHDLSAYTVKVDVPESLMITASPDVEKRPKVFASFETLPGKQFPLTFKEVSTQPDPNSKTYQATFIMKPNADYNILPGMSVMTKGKPATATGLKDIFVPANAVQEDELGRFVYRVKPSDTDQNTATIERAEVTTGQLTELGVEIRSGLSKGDKIVVAGVSKMREGLNVKLMGE